MAVPEVVRRATLLDEFLPVYEFSDTSSIVVHASPAEIFRANREVTFGELRSMRPLSWLRSLPAALAGQEKWGAIPPSARFMDVSLGPDSPWILLGEEPDAEVVLGLIGRFSQPRIECVTLRDAADFKAIVDPTLSRTALSIRVVPGGSPAEGHTLVIESRTHVPDAAMRRRFARYWAVIRPFEGVMACEALRAIKRRAEAAAGTAEAAPRPSLLRVGLPLAIGAALGLGALVYRRRHASG